MKMKRDNIGLSRYFFVSLLELFEIIIARSPDHRAFDANQLNSALGVSLLLLVAAAVAVAETDQIVIGHRPKFRLHYSFAAQSALRTAFDSGLGLARWLI